MQQLAFPWFPLYPAGPMQPRAVVVAVGDPHGEKDAVGSLILRELAGQGLCPSVSMHLLGRRPDRLPALVERETGSGEPPELLLILDAITSVEEQPGTVIVSDFGEPRGAKGRLSSHVGTVSEALGLLRLALGERAPKQVMLVGIVVGRDCRGPLPASVRRAVPGAAERVTRILRENTYGLPCSPAP